MVQSTKITPRGWLLMGAGIVLLGAGLYLLGQTVFLDEYDATGMQVNCGNGFESQLLQATVDDEKSGLSGTATNYVDQCVQGIRQRRAWAAPLAGLGALLVIAEVSLWVRRGAAWAGISGPNGEGGGWSAKDHPDQEMHEAADLDRREREHRSGPSTTTPSTL
ncbi:MAG TPA: hypothetical protein VFR17_08845 [Mycobacterium sp.]|nr:hypothetical protein [Mycobacterium sp.]